jgi:endonuclease G
MQHFGKNKIPIPDAFFKVILCTSGNPKALGFIFPNDGTHHALKNYMMSVDEVEDSTGFDFFPVLADSIEAEVESCSNLVDWK